MEFTREAEERNLELSGAVIDWLRLWETNAPVDAQLLAVKKICAQLRDCQAFYSSVYKTLMGC